MLQIWRNFVEKLHVGWQKCSPGQIQWNFGLKIPPLIANKKLKSISYPKKLNFMPFSHSKSTQTKNKLLIKGVSVDSQHSVKSGYKFTEKFGPPARIPRGRGVQLCRGLKKNSRGGSNFWALGGYTPPVPMYGGAKTLPYYSYCMGEQGKTFPRMIRFSLPEWAWQRGYISKTA